MRKLAFGLETNTTKVTRDRLEFTLDAGVGSGPDISETQALEAAKVRNVF